MIFVRPVLRNRFCCAEGAVSQDRFYGIIIVVPLLQTKSNIRSLQENEIGQGKLTSALTNGNAAGDSRTLTPCDSDLFSIKATVSGTVALV